jgi:dUTP pyrophosphatase
MQQQFIVQVETGGRLPTNREGDAGYDLYAAEAISIPPGQRKLINTGCHMQIPAGHFGSIRSRSSLAVAGLDVCGGVVDSSYRGLVKVILHNSIEDYNYEVKVGDKIAQLIIQPCINPPIQEGSVDSTVRGEGGFGSTGR